MPIEYYAIVLLKDDEKQKSVRVADADLTLAASAIETAVQKIIASTVFNVSGVTVTDMKSVTKITELHEELI